MAARVSPERYNRYKQAVLEMSPAIQYCIGTVVQRETSSLSDREIAERLGLTEEEVTEIRCIAEIDLLPLDTWRDSADWQREKARRFFGKPAGASEENQEQWKEKKEEPDSR